MSDQEKNPASLLDNTAPPRSGSQRKKRVRLIGWLVLLVVLLTGIFLLVTNGIYLWQIRADQAAISAARTQLMAKMPDSARTEADRLAFYQDCSEQLGDLPAKLAALNAEPWTFAVLLKDDINLNELQGMIDQINRGQTAVKTYLEAIGKIQKGVADFIAAADPAVSEADTLTAALSAYQARIAAAETLETQYTALDQLTDLDLAGHLYSRTELKLDAVAADISTFRQPVTDLQTLLDKSETLEATLDDLYAREPLKADLDDFTADCAKLLADQQVMIADAASLAKQLPKAMQKTFSNWQAGLSTRTDFIENLQTWWQDKTQVEQSLTSAETDRATARRYIADSLKEENVETAYLWTKTAQEYRTSMSTAIDFANIYIGRTNQVVSDLGTSRQVYRQALGLAAAVRKIDKLAYIKADEFWLES